jgi:hypothetical protein
MVPLHRMKHLKWRRHLTCFQNFLFCFPVRKLLTDLEIFNCHFLIIIHYFDYMQKTSWIKNMSFIVLQLSVNILFTLKAIQRCSCDIHVLLFSSLQSGCLGKAQRHVKCWLQVAFTAKKRPDLQNVYACPCRAKDRCARSFTSKTWSMLRFSPPVLLFVQRHMKSS